jgi:hypothetical protein
MAHWSVPFDVLAKKTKTDIETVIRAAAFKLFSDVVIRSPVDTGRFRANWNVSHNTIDTTVTENVQKDMMVKMEQVRSALLNIPIGGTFWLANSLPYALVLEYGMYPNLPTGGEDKTIGGYSRQAPHGMVRISAREFAANVERAVRSKPS